MTWQGLTAGGLKGPAARATQAAFDAREAEAREQNRQVEIDYAPSGQHSDGRTVARTDSVDVHLDGGFDRGACTCNWRRDGVLGLAKRLDGTLIEGTLCPSCGKGLYKPAFRSLLSDPA